MDWIAIIYKNEEVVRKYQFDMKSFKWSMVHFFLQIFFKHVTFFQNLNLTSRGVKTNGKTGYIRYIFGKWSVNHIFKTFDNKKKNNLRYDVVWTKFVSWQTFIMYIWCLIFGRHTQSLILGNGEEITGKMLTSSYQKQSNSYNIRLDITLYFC